MPKRKSTTRTFDDRFADEMAESFGDLHKLGMIDDDAYKLTLRDLNREGGEAVIAPVSAGEIRALREKAHVSQAALAKYLNLSVDQARQTKAIVPNAA